MAEYIERENVLKIFMDMANASAKLYPGLMTAYSQIKTAPTADVRPERHERWIEKRGYNIPLDMYAVSYNCSCCGNTVYKKYVFCPNCGAKMDGKDSRE